MTLVADIREGLKANLETIDGFQVNAYALSNPTSPSMDIELSKTTYDAAMRSDNWRFTVSAFVALTSDIGAQKRLDELLSTSGARSVKAAIESDCTLGGVVDDLRVTETSGHKTFAGGTGGKLLGAEWLLEVLASR